MPNAADTSLVAPDDAVARCTTEARRDGLFAGLSAALAGAILGNKLFRFNRNTTIMCGGVTGVLSGYQFYQGFLASNLARLRAEQAKRQQSESVFGEDLSANKFQ